MNFWDIYYIGMLAATIRTLIILFGDPKETGEVLVKAAKSLEIVMSRQASKRTTVIMVVVVLGLLIVIWPISLPWSVYGWYLRRKEEKAKKGV